MLREARHAVRRLRSAPGFTIAGILLLGLGVGAATAMFSIVEAMLFDPLVPAEDRVVVLHEKKQSEGDPFSEISLPHFFDWKERNTSFLDMAAFGASNTSYTLLLGPGESIPMETATVSPSFFDTLGVLPLLGRGFDQDEDLPESDHVVVLSYDFWRQVLGGDPQILGRRITLEQKERHAYSVVGVMPAGFDFPNRARIWIPLRKEDPIWPGRGYQFLFAVGRLAPGASVERAEAELNTLIPQIYRENDIPQAETRRIHTVPIRDYFLGENTRSALWILQAASATLLLIACTNLASLFLVRAASRTREMAVRTALGASRGQVTQAFLAETALLSIAGGVLGILLARGAVSSMIALAPSWVPRLDRVETDGSILLFSLVAAAAAAFIVAMGPVLTPAKSVIEVISSRGVGPPSRGVVLRQFLVTLQIATTLILVVGASLLMASLVKVSRVDLGYRPEQLLLLSVKGPAEEYASVQAQRTLVRQSIDRVGSLGGVSAAGAVLVPPFGAGALGWDIWWVAESQNAPWETTVRENPETGEKLTLSHPSLEFMEENPPANWEVVSGSYFQAMGIPLLKGRTFRDDDDEEAPRVVIVSESFARKLWPNEEPIGKRLITLGHRVDENRRSEWQDVVGVVGDARYRELTGTRLDLYVAYPQSPFVPNVLAVRTAGDPLSVVDRLRAALVEVEPNLRIEHVRTMSSVIESQLTGWRFRTALITIFAAAALVLASVGVFGLVAQGVSQRAPEIGLRMALGADARRVLRLVIEGGMKSVLVGISFGLVFAGLGSRVLAAHLYEIEATDPMTYGVVTVLVFFVAVLACYLPARRASRLDPAVALRSE